MVIGDIIKTISDMDSVQGFFVASILLYFWNITQPFQTMSEAVDKTYKTSSRTARKDHCGRADGNLNCIGHFYRLHDCDLPGAWEANKTNDGEVAQPNGISNPSAVSPIQPIMAEDFAWEKLLRIPQPEFEKTELVLRVIPFLWFSRRVLVSLVSIIFEKGYFYFLIFSSFWFYLFLFYSLFMFLVGLF